MTKSALTASTAIFFGLVAQTLASDAAAASCTKADIQSRICKITSYDPSMTPYNAPVCISTTDYGTPIGNAFAVAPAQVQEELCRLANIFVQTDSAAYSWGYFENPATKYQPTAPRNFVGIKADVTTANLAAVLDQDFKDTFKNTTPSLNPVHTVSSNSNELGVLLVLAHEIAHIKWHRDGIYWSLPCYYKAFIENSWTPGDDLKNTVIRTWHPTFSDAAAGGNPPAPHKDSSLPNPHKNGLNPGEVKKLYENGFVSAIAAISPEEDFVETYALQSVLGSLTPPGAINLTINGGGNTVAIPDASSQSKRDCIASALVLSRKAPTSSKYRVRRR